MSSVSDDGDFSGLPSPEARQISPPTTPMRHAPATPFRRPIAAGLLCLAVSAAGCSSVITMRDALRESVEQAAAMTQMSTLGDLDPPAPETGPADRADYDGTGSETAATSAELADSLADDPAAIAAAIEAAIADLTETDALDTASKAALIETLQLTPQTDWPVVIDEFTSTLTALREAAAEPVAKPGETAAAISAAPAAAIVPDSRDTDAATDPATTETAVAASVAQDDATPPAAAENPDAVSVAAASESPPRIEEVAAATERAPPAVRDASVQPPPQQRSEAAGPPPSTTATSVEASLAAQSLPETSPAAAADSPTAAAAADFLAIKNPCLARQVRGWGLVDRFDPAELHPGAEVIAYFELTGIHSEPAGNGVRTSIDTRLRLEDPLGNRLHAWSFPPLTETCGARRRDYFARYLLDLPNELPPGNHQLVLTVTDLQAGNTAEATIPLPVTAR